MFVCLFVSTFASLTMIYRIVKITIEALTTIVTIPTGRVVLAADAHATATLARQQVQLFVEATLVRMRVAIAS